MNIRNLRRRHLAQRLCLAASALSAAMLLLSGAVFLTARPEPAGAASSGGIPTVTPASGGSGAEFSLTLPDGAACTGDTAKGGYLVQTYLVAASIDPATLTFDANGPVSAAVGANLRQPLFGTDTQKYINQGTNIAASENGPGIISGLPSFTFSVFGPDVSAVVPPGVYNVGVACTLGLPGANQLDRFWNTQLTFSADAADPGGVTWVETPPSPTDSTTTTTAGGDTTTTTSTDGSTTTTTDGSTTTTAGEDTTTTAVGGGDVAGGGFSGGSPSGASPVSTAGQLPYTGSSPVPMIVWAIALIVFGRMAMLLGKRPKVIGDEPTG